MRLQQQQRDVTINQPPIG